MLMQLSAGMHPTRECMYAVGRVYSALHMKYPSIQTVQKVQTGDKSYKSIVFSCNDDCPIKDFTGTIKCIFTSPFRPHHKRKNWYIDLSEIPEINAELTTFRKPGEGLNELDTEQFKIKTFRCSGNGGQNVNKVETGVEIYGKFYDITVRATEQRTQHENLKLAFAKMSYEIHKLREQELANAKNEAWKKHNQLIRGNETLTFDWSK